jgi:hypothetical protein
LFLILTIVVAIVVALFFSPPLFWLLFLSASRSDKHEIDTAIYPNTLVEIYPLSDYRFPVILWRLTIEPSSGSYSNGYKAGRLGACDVCR